MKKLLFVFYWFFGSLTIIVSSILMLLSSSPPVQNEALFENHKSSFVVLGAYNEESSIISNDARPVIIENFLRKYHFTLEPYDYYAHLFVQTADKYSLDFRLLPAIAMQESNLCRKAPVASNNCWGHGIYGGKVIYYESFETAMESVAKTLTKYSKSGLASPEEIMRKYTPQSQGEWAAGVLHFMAEMR